MKKILVIFLAAVSVLSTVSCTDDIKNQLEEMKVRISDLEAVVANINDYYTNISKIVTALEDHDMIRSVTTVRRNDGSEAYLVTFVSGQTLTLIQGIDGISPNLGIRKYDDGRYYWTVQYGTEEPQWLLSNLGLKIRASALTPQMKIEDGWWQYSYDNGATWTRLCKATGESGSSVFKNISVNDYFVTFTLINGGTFQVATEAYFNRIIERCGNFAAEMELAGQVLAGVDTTVAVRSISQIMDGEDLVGYKLVLKNGQEFTIRTGKDEQPFIFSIKRDESDGVDYWQVKIGESDPTWVVKPDGSKARASAMHGTPKLSVRDTLDSYFFVYSFYPDINDYQWLRDSEGKLVEACTNFDNVAMFRSVRVGTENVALTMADGKTIYLPFYYETNPTIEFRAPEGVNYNASTYLYSYARPDTTYTIKYKIINAPDNLQLDAIAMDGATVTDIVVPESGATRTGTIKFKTPSGFPENTATTRVLVFMTWGSNVTMKVLEFVNQN